MIIDYSKIEEQLIEGFKGGNGQLATRNYVDAKNKVMMSRLKPGANIGYHSHDANSEIIRIPSGKTGEIDPLRHRFRDELSEEPRRRRQRLHRI